MLENLPLAVGAALLGGFAIGGLVTLRHRPLRRLVASLAENRTPHATDKDSLARALVAAMASAAAASTAIGATRTELDRIDHER